MGIDKVRKSDSSSVTTDGAMPDVKSANAHEANDDAGGGGGERGGRGVRLEAAEGEEKREVEKEGGS